MHPFNKFLKITRDEKKISIRDLASTSGLNKNSIVRFEKDEMVPTLLTAVKILKGLRADSIDFQEFFTGETIRNTPKYGVGFPTYEDLDRFQRLIQTNEELAYAFLRKWVAKVYEKAPVGENRIALQQQKFEGNDANVHRIKLLKNIWLHPPFLLPEKNVIQIYYQGGVVSRHDVFVYFYSFMSSDNIFDGFLIKDELFKFTDYEQSQNVRLSTQWVMEKYFGENGSFLILPLRAVEFDDRIHAAKGFAGLKPSEEWWIESAFYCDYLLLVISRWFLYLQEPATEFISDLRKLFGAAKLTD